MGSRFGKIWSTGWGRAGLIILAVILFLIFVLPLFINANTFRPMLESQLSRVIGRQVTIGDLSFSVLAGGLKAKDISIAGDPAFGAEPFLEAKALSIKVEMWPLVFRRQLIVDGLTISSPSIRLVSDGKGKWNFSSAGKTAARGTGAHENAIPDLTIGAFNLRDGSAQISTIGSSTPPTKLSKINLAVERFSFSKSFPFEFSAAMGGGGQIHITGTAGPVSREDASDTPFSANVELKNFNPVAEGFIAPGEGIGLVADGTAKVQSDGTTLISSGNIHARHLKLVRTGRPAPRPVDILYSVRYDLDARTGEINQLDLKTGAVAAHLSGTYQLAAQGATVALNLSVPHVPVDQVETLLPAAGVNLPSGSRLQGGTITARLAVAGPLSALTISGPVEMDNTRLAGFDLGSKIQGLNPVRGAGGGTEIRVLRANVSSSPSITQIGNLYLEVPALGTATGNGSISPAGALNFHLLARLNPTTGAASQALAGLGAVHGLLGQIVDTAAQKGIPLTVTGTTQDPHIQADVSGLIRKNAGSVIEQQLQNRLSNGKQKPNAGSILNRLFGGH